MLAWPSEVAGIVPSVTGAITDQLQLLTDNDISIRQNDIVQDNQEAHKPQTTNAPIWNHDILDQARVSHP